MTSKIDDSGKTIAIDPISQIVRADGIIVCKVVNKDGKIYLQFKDGDRLRSRCRGAMFVEVSLDAFAEALKSEEFWSKIVIG